MELKMRTFLKEYAAANLSFNSVQFKVVVAINNDVCSVRYIAKTSNELEKLNNVYGKEKVAKKIKEHLQKRLNTNVMRGSTREAGLAFVVSTTAIEEHILNMIS